MDGWLWRINKDIYEEIHQENSLKQLFQWGSPAGSEHWLWHGKAEVLEGRKSFRKSQWNVSGTAPPSMQGLGFPCPAPALIVGNYNHNNPQLLSTQKANPAGLREGQL